MESAIRFSQNSLAGGSDQQFLKIDVSGKSFRLCKITKESKHNLQYETIYTSVKVPAFRAFDWHPVDESLVAVGQSGGEATLLKLGDGYQDSITFSVRSQRLCNAVALSPQNLIAVGLERVRTDFCLNIWDFNQRLPAAGSKNFSKSNYADPVHKLGSGEIITSLKFFNADPHLLVAGMKGQYVRLYDLREPNPNNGLQFATRCVNNLAVDHQDENYFASCFPSTDPTVNVWDRRMVTRSGSGQTGHGNALHSEHRQPELPLELKNVIGNSATIWSLRFSKTRRGCLGLLSNLGQLKVYDIGKEFTADLYRVDHRLEGTAHGWTDQSPQDVYLNSVQELEQGNSGPRKAMEEKKQVVSFDFMTNHTRSRQPKLILLTGEGHVTLTSMKPAPEPSAFSPTGTFYQGTNHVTPVLFDTIKKDVAGHIDKIRRSAEPRNSLKQAYKQSKLGKTSGNGNHLDLRRMSSYANHSWNTDLGFLERDVSLRDMLGLLSVSHYRCEAGYLLSAAKNKTIAADSPWIGSFWDWIQHAERISKDGGMMQDNLDLSFVGVFGLWMEEISTKSRQLGTFSLPFPKAMRNLVTRLNISAKSSCPTEYPWHRKLCLYVSGLAWSRQELENMVQKLVNANQHTKAAALAIFADEQKLAYKALRARTAGQSHKMLAMAIAGAKRQALKSSKAAPPQSSSKAETQSSDTDSGDDWTETIASLSSDLTDPYARAILAFVKSDDWQDVINVDALPLKHRIGIALRHLNDSKLTTSISQLTREAISRGDIEGIILTGTGTKEGLALMSNYARIFNDLQTAVLGLCAGGAAPKFQISSMPTPEEARTARKFEAMREVYRSTIMSWNLKFNRVRFDVTSSRAAAAAISSSSSANSDSVAIQSQQSRKREQIRLVCTYCSGSLSLFNGNNTATIVQNYSTLGPTTLSAESKGALSVSTGTTTPLGPPIQQAGIGSSISQTSSGRPSPSSTPIPNVNSSASTNGGGGLSGPPNQRMIETPHKNPLTNERAAVMGTVCPKCGRHLPRCGVCDLWLGTPDESYARWFTNLQKQQQQQVQQIQNQQSGKSIADKTGSVSGGVGGKSTDRSAVPSIDLSASLSGSIVTTIGPPTNPTTSSSGTLNKATSSTSLRDFANATNTNNANLTSPSKPYNPEIIVPSSSSPTDAAISKAKDEYVRLLKLQEHERQWMDAMQRFIVFCVSCGHGFHAGHARLWFEGAVPTVMFGADDGEDESRGERDMLRREGHRICPVAGCECRCNG